MIIKNYSNFNTYKTIPQNFNNLLLMSKYSFFFISLISPFILNNLKLTYFDIKSKKALIKQSYILFTWFYYISSISLITDKKRLKINIFPKKTYTFTLTKAPMAHKNWSKEQFKFQYFKFKISFKSKFETESKITAINKASLLTLITKKKITIFETNTLFLKYFNLNFFYTDQSFFNYHNFIKIN